MALFSTSRALTLAALSATCVASLSQAAEHPTSGADERPSLALLTLKTGEGFTAAEAGTIEQLILSALHDSGRFKVIGRSDIDTLLNLDAKKQVLGCNDDACMTEIAGALGVELVAAGDVGRIGRTIVLNLRIISVHTATVVARSQNTLKSDDDLVDACRVLVDKAVADLGLSKTPSAGSPTTAPVALAPIPPPAAPPSIPSAAVVQTRWQRPLAWTLMSVGAALLGVGTGFGVSTQQLQSQLRGQQHVTGQVNVAEKQASANSQARAADAMFGVGGTLAAVGVGLRVAF